jgi:pyroglutamyl-peptidase
MKILLTAFEPFDNLPTNSSLEVLKRINIDNVIKAELPVSYERVKIKLKELVDEYHPDFIINLGQAGGETKLRIEKFALNYTRATIADNDSDLRLKGEVFKGEELAKTTILDIEELVRISNLDNHECYISLSAGGYICNTTYYTSLYLNNNKALFIHLPYFTGQIENKNTVSLDKMVEDTTYFAQKVIEEVSKM